ncbi:hypothetical protein GTA08_BOTSDO05462 [Neofusicoccum parvum]|uniref:Uncharacterized protein n=1 Tax=Neofusicoccum parvum TaxID=310453 RepID=A0ACB5RRD6_9PEZI|nr:hypothetical protein GTA08_BOTSDO05462 [Neofusicoccum parvum]
MTHETPRPEHEREEPVTAALPPLDPMATIAPADEEFFHERYNPIYTIVPTKPVIVNQDNNYDRCVFTERPLCGPLLFANNTSDARDHCANERTFLSWLRLAVYMAIVSVAIVISFHLKAQPSDLGEHPVRPVQTGLSVV